MELALLVPTVPTVSIEDLFQFLGTGGGLANTNGCFIPEFGGEEDIDIDDEEVEENVFALLTVTTFVGIVGVTYEGGGGGTGALLADDTELRVVDGGVDLKREAIALTGAISLSFPLPTLVRKPSL